MKKSVLLSLICTGFVVTMPFSASALNTQTVNQHLDRQPNSLLAQLRGRDRDFRRRHHERRYYVYYRSPRELQWTLEGPHSSRRDAERATRRLERRGFRTYIGDRFMGRPGRNR